MALAPTMVRAEVRSWGHHFGYDVIGSSQGQTVHGKNHKVTKSAGGFKLKKNVFRVEMEPGNTFSWLATLHARHGVHEHDSGVSRVVLSAYSVIGIFTRTFCTLQNWENQWGRWFPHGERHSEDCLTVLRWMMFIAEPSFRWLQQEVCISSQLVTSVTNTVPSSSVEGQDLETHEHSGQHLRILKTGWAKERPNNN